MSKLSVKVDGHRFVVEINSIFADGSPFEVEVDGEKLVVLVPQGGDSGMVDWLLVDGRPYEIVLDADMGWMSSRTGLHSLEIRDMAMAVQRSVSGDGRIKSSGRFIEEPQFRVVDHRPCKSQAVFHSF